MNTQENFKFQALVSVEKYYTKEDVGACIGSWKNEQNREIKAKYGRSTKHKVTYNLETLTIPEFFEKVTTGHTVANIFCPNNKKAFIKGDSYTYINSKNELTLSAKCDAFFVGSNFISIDIDETQYTFNEYIQKLIDGGFTPTLFYTTFSHELPGKGQRFRLMYFFETLIEGKLQYKYMAEGVINLIESIVNEKVVDDCTKKCSQAIHGTNINSEYLEVKPLRGYSGKVYVNNSIWPFISEKSQKEIDDYINREKISKELDIAAESDEYIAKVDEYIAKQEEITSKEIIDWDMVENMKKLTYKDFMHIYSTRYNLVYREDIDFGEKNIIKAPENYWRLWWYQNPVLDGNRRRWKCRKQAALRRRAKMDISTNEMIFNIYLDVYKHNFFDNSDGIFTIDYIVKMAKFVNSLNEEKLLAYTQDSLDFLQELYKDCKFVFKGGLSKTERN